MIVFPVGLYSSATAATPAQWDTSINPSSLFVYTNSNRTVENVAGSGNPQSTRTTTSRSSGKAYVEMLADVCLSDSYPAVGLGNASADITDTYPGFDTNSFGWFWDAGFWYNENFTPYTPPSIGGNGNRMCLALDFGAKRLYGRINNGTWFGSTSSADPVAGTNGYDFSGIAGPYYLLHCGRYSGSLGYGSKATTAFQSSDYFYSPPSGYGDW